MAVLLPIVKLVSSLDFKSSSFDCGLAGVCLCYGLFPLKMLCWQFTTQLPCLIRENEKERNVEEMKGRVVKTCFVLHSFIHLTVKVQLSFSAVLIMSMRKSTSFFLHTNSPSSCWCSLRSQFQPLIWQLSCCKDDWDVSCRRLWTWSEKLISMSWYNLG